MVDAAGLADATVRGAEHRIGIGIQRPRAVLERAREERIEILVRGGIRFVGFVEIDVVLPDEIPDQRVLPRRERPARRPAHDAREKAMRQEILRGDGGAHQPEPDSASRSAAIVFATNGGRNRPASRPLGSMMIADAL